MSSPAALLGESRQHPRPKKSGAKNRGGQVGGETGCTREGWWDTPAGGPRDSMGAGDSGTRGAPRQQHDFRSGQRKVGFGEHRKGLRNQGFGKSWVYWARRSKLVFKLTWTEIGAWKQLRWFCHIDLKIGVDSEL